MIMLIACKLAVGHIYSGVKRQVLPEEMRVIDQLQHAEPVGNDINLGILHGCRQHSNARKQRYSNLYTCEDYTTNRTGYASKS